MRRARKQFKLFLDTSALLSGLNSPTGASGFILSLFKTKKIKIAISPEVIREAEDVIVRKFPLLKNAFLEFVRSKPLITKKLTKTELQHAYKQINSEDTPILAGAVKAKAGYLITLDKRFQKLARNKAKIIIVLPSEFLKLFRK